MVNVEGVQRQSMGLGIRVREPQQDRGIESAGQGNGKTGVGGCAQHIKAAREPGREWALLAHSSVSVVSLNLP